MSDNPTNKIIQQWSNSFKYKRSDTAWTVSKRPPTRNRVFPPKTSRQSHRAAMISHSDSTLESTRMSPGNGLTSSSDVLLDSSKNISDLPLSSLSSAELPSEHQTSTNRPSRNEPKFGVVSRLRETPTRDKQDKPYARDDVVGKVEAEPSSNRSKNFARGDRMARCRGDSEKLSKCPPVALPRPNSKLCREKKIDDVNSGDGREKQKQKTTSLRRIGIRVSSLDGSRKMMESKKPEVTKRDAGRCHSDVEVSKSQKDKNECRNQVDDSLQQSQCQKVCEAPNLAARRTSDSHSSGQRHEAVDASSRVGAPADWRHPRNVYSEPKPPVNLKGVGHQNPMALAYKMSKEVVPEPQPTLEVRYNAPTMWTNTHSETAAPQNVLIKKKLFKFVVKKPTQPANSKPSRVADIAPKCSIPPAQIKDSSIGAFQRPAIDIPAKKLSVCSDHKSKCDESKSDIKKIQNSQLLQRSQQYPPVPKTPSPQPENTVERDVTTNKDPTITTDSTSGRSDNSTSSTLDILTPSRDIHKPSRDTHTPSLDVHTPSRDIHTPSRVINSCLVEINRSLDTGDAIKPSSHPAIKNSPPEVRSNRFQKVVNSVEGNQVPQTDTVPQTELVTVPSTARKSVHEVSENIPAQSSSNSRPAKCESNKKTNDKTNTSVSASEKYSKPDRWRPKPLTGAATKQNTALDGVVGQRTNGNEIPDAKVKSKLKSRNSSAPPSDQRVAPAQTHQQLENSKTNLDNKELKSTRHQKDLTVGKSPPKQKDQTLLVSESCPKSPKKIPNDTKQANETPGVNQESGKLQTNMNNRKKCCSPKNAQLLGDYTNNDDAAKPVSERRAIQKPDSISKCLGNNNLKMESGVVSSSKNVKKSKPSIYEDSPGSCSEGRVAACNETPLPANPDTSANKKQVDLHRSRSWDQSSKKSADDDEGEIGENRRGIHSKINSEINEIVEVVLEFLTKRKEMSAQRSPDLNQETSSALMASSSPLNSAEATADQPIQSPPTDAAQLSSTTSIEMGQFETPPPQESVQQAHKFESIRTYFESQVNRLGAFGKDTKYSGYSQHRNYLKNMKSPTSEPRLDTLDVTIESSVERKRSETSRNSKSACIQSPTSLGVTSTTTYSDNYEAQSRLQKLRALVPNEQGDKVEILQQPIPSARKSPIDKSFIKRRMRIGQILKSKFEHNIHPRNSSCDRSRSKSAVYLSGSDTSVSQASSSFTLKSNKSHHRDSRHEEINREKEKISCRCAAIHSILNDLKHHILLERVGQQMYTPTQLPNYDDLRLEEREFNESGKVGRTESSYSKASTSDGASHYSKEKNDNILTSSRPLPKPRCKIPRFVPSGNQTKVPPPMADISCDSDYLKIIASIIKNNAIISDEQHPQKSGVEVQRCADYDRKSRSRPRESKSFIEHFCKQLVESWQLKQAPSDEAGSTSREQQPYLAQERLTKASRASTKVYKKGGEKFEHLERNDKYHLGQGEIQDYDEMNSLAMSNFLPSGWMKFSRNIPDFSKIFGQKRSCSNDLKEAQGYIGDAYKETISAHIQAKTTLLEHQSKNLKQREEKYATENRKSEKKVENSRQKFLNHDDLRNKSIRELLEFAYSQKNNEDISKQIVREIYERASRKQSDVKYKKQLREGALQLFCLLTSQSVSEESNNLEQELFDESCQNEEERCRGTLEKSTEVSHVEDSVERSANLQDAYTIMKAEYVERIKENQRIIDQWSLSPSNKYPTEDVESPKETTVDTKICQSIPLEENICVLESNKLEACIDEASIRQVVKTKPSSKKGVTFVLPSYTAMINDGIDTLSGSSDDKIADAKSPPKETHQAGGTNEGPRKDDASHKVINEEVVDTCNETPRCDETNPYTHGAAMKTWHPENQESLSRKFGVNPTEAHTNLDSPTISEDIYQSHLSGDRGTGHAPSSPRNQKISGKSETKRSCENDVPEPLEYVPKSFRSPEIIPETGHNKLNSPKRGDLPASPAAASTRNEQKKLADKLTECRSCKTMYKSRLNDEGSTPTKDTPEESVISHNCNLADEKNVKPWCASSPQDQDGGAAIKDQPLLSPKRTTRRDPDKKPPDSPRDQSVVPSARNRRFVDTSRSPESRKSTREPSPYAEKKFATDMSTLLETHNEEDEVKSDCEVADAKLPVAYKPTCTSPQAKKPTGLSPVKPTGLSPVKPTGLSPLFVTKQSETSHKQETSNLQKIESPDRNVKNRAVGVKHVQNKLSADSYDRHTHDGGKFAVESRVQNKGNEDKHQIDTKTTVNQRHSTPPAIKETLDKQESVEPAQHKHNNDEAKQVRGDKPLPRENKLQNIQTTANMKEVNEDKLHQKSLKASTDSKPKGSKGKVTEDILEHRMSKKCTPEPNEGESFENSVGDDKTLPSDENSDKHAQENSFNLHSEEESDRTLCETAVSEKMFHGNSNVASEDQKGVIENSMNTDAACNADKTSSTVEGDKNSVDDNLTRTAMNRNSSKEELAEETGDVKDLRASADKKCETGAAHKGQLLREIKEQDKCGAFFCGAEASEVDSSKGIDELMESEIKMVASGGDGEAPLCLKQVDKASGVAAQDTHDVGTEMSQLSECRYARGKKVESISQKRVEKGCDAYSRAEDGANTDKVTKEPGKSMGEPGKSTDEPDKNTGEPDKNTGEPGKSTGEPGKSTGEPGKSTGEPEALLSSSEKNTASRQTIHLKTASPTSPTSPTKGYSYNKPDSPTSNLSSHRNQLLNQLSGSKNQPQKPVEDRKPSPNLPDPTNTFLNITKSRSKTLNQVDFRNAGDDTAVTKIQSMNFNDPTKQSWNLKVSQNQTLNLVLPKNKPFNLVDPLNQPLDLSDLRNLPLDLSGRQYQVLDLSHPRSHQVTRKDSIYEALDLSDPRKHKLNPTGSMYKLYNQVEPMNLTLRQNDSKKQTLNLIEHRQPINTHEPRNKTFNLNDPRNQAFNLQSHGNQFMSQNEQRIQTFNFNVPNNQIFAPNELRDPNLNDPRYQGFYQTAPRHPISNLTDVRSGDTRTVVSHINPMMPVGQANIFQSTERLPSSNLANSINAPIRQIALLETSPRHSGDFVQQGDFPFRCPVFNDRNKVEVLNVQENDLVAPPETGYQSINKTNLVKPIGYGDPHNDVVFNQVNYPSPLYQTSPPNMSSFLNQKYPHGYYQPQRQANFVNQAFPMRQPQPQAQSNFVSQANLNYLQPQNQSTPVNQLHCQADANFINQGNLLNNQQPRNQTPFLNQVPPVNHPPGLPNFVPPCSTSKHSQPPSSTYLLGKNRPVCQPNDPNQSGLYSNPTLHTQLLQQASLGNQVQAIGQSSPVFNTPSNPHSAVSSSQSLKYPQNSANNASQLVDIQPIIVKKDNTKSNTELNACTTPPEYHATTKLKCQSAPSHFTECTSPNNTLSESCVVNQDIHVDKTNSLNQISALQLSNQTAVPFTSSSVGYEACSKPNSVKFSDPLISYASHAPTSINADSKNERCNEMELSKTSVASHHLRDQSSANSQQHRMFDSEYTCEAWRAADTFSYTQETLSYDNEYLLSDLSRYENSEFSKVADMTTQVSRSHLYVATQMSSTDTIHSLPMAYNPEEVGTGRDRAWQSFDTVDAPDPTQLASSSSALFNHQVSYSIAVECLIQNDPGYDKAEQPKRVMTPIEEDETSERESNSGSSCENKGYFGSRCNPNSKGDLHPMYDPRRLNHHLTMDYPERWKYPETVVDYVCANGSADGDSLSSVEKQAQGLSALNRSASDCISQIPKDKTSVNDVFEYPIQYRLKGNPPMYMNEIQRLQSHRNAQTPQKRMKPSPTLFLSPEASNLRYATVFDGGTPAAFNRDPIHKMPAKNTDEPGTRRSYPKPSMFNRPLAFVRPEEPLDLSDTTQSVNSTVRNSSLNSETSVTQNNIPTGKLPGVAVKAPKEFPENNFYSDKKKGVCNPYTLDPIAQTKQAFPQPVYKSNNMPKGYEPMGFGAQANQKNSKTNEGNPSQATRAPQYPGHYKVNPVDAFNYERVYNRVTDCMRANLDQFAAGQMQKIRSKPDKRLMDASEFSNKPDERFRQYSAPSGLFNSSNIDTTNCFRESPSDNLQDFPVVLRPNACGSERAKDFRASSPTKSLKTKRNKTKPQKKFSEAEKRLFPCVSYSWNGSENKNASQQHERCERSARDNVSFDGRSQRPDTGELGKAGENLLSKHRNTNPHFAWADVCADLSSKLDRPEKMQSTNFSMDASLGLRMEDFYAGEDDNYPIVSCYSSIASIEGVSGSSSDMTIKSSFHSDADVSSSGEVSRARARSSPDRKVKNVHQPSACTLADSMSVSESFHSCSSRLSFS